VNDKSVKMPADYWREMSEAADMSSKPNMETALRAAFYFGCMVSIMFMAKLTVMESSVDLLARWQRDVENNTDGMMEMWRKERDGS
jgi:hypothetical protein